MKMARDLFGKLLNRNLVLGPDVVDAKVFSFLDHQQQSRNQIVDENKRSSFFAAAFDWQDDRALTLTREFVHAQSELRDDVFPSHVRAVNIVRTEYHGAPQLFATV